MRETPQPGTPDFIPALVLPDIFNHSNFEYSAFSSLKVNSMRRKTKVGKNETTPEIYKNFLKNGLQIQDPSETRIADIHRLLQRLVYCNKKRKCRPITIKLTSAMDKSKIFRLTKHLKKYNDSYCEASSSSGSQSTEHKVYITNHLPRIFY